MCQDCGVSETRVYSGIPGAQRRLDRSDRLIAAAFELLATDGTAGLTIRKVAAKAGLSTRYVYEGFTDLDNLMSIAFDTAAEEIGGKLIDAVAQAESDPRAQLTAVIDTVATFVTDEPHKAKLLLTDSFGDPTLAARRLKVTQVFSAGFSHYVRSYLPTPGKAGRTVDLAARFLVGATAETFTAWLQGALPYPRQQLVDDTVELFLGTIESLTRIGD
jgi:AcrR family transcriptional regulator